MTSPSGEPFDLASLPRALFAFPGPLRDTLVAAVLDGRKTATTGLVADYEHGDEALPEIIRRGRTPLTVGEGISWLLQDPAMLLPDHCFMTIGSRKLRGHGSKARMDARLGGDRGEKVTERRP